MAVREAFSDGLLALRTTPALLVAGAPLVALPLAGAVDIGPRLGPFLPLALFLAAPFFLGGFLGTAVEAVRGEGSSLQRFVRAGLSTYGRLLAASVLVVVGVLGLMVLLTAATLLPIAAVALTGGGDIALVGLAVTVLLSSLATFLWVPVALLFVQFVAPAIVAEDRGVRGAFARSAGLVRHNLGNVVAFSVVWLVVVGLVPHPQTLLERGIEWTAPTPGLPEQTVSTALLAVAVLASSAALIYCYTVHTAYFLRLGDEQSERRLTPPRHRRPVGTR